MSFREKLTWVSAAVWVLVIALYLRAVAAQLGTAPVADIAYQRPILIAMGTMIALTIAGSIVTAIVTAAGGAISALRSGRQPRRDIDREDERDARIGRRGDATSFHVTSVLLLGVLALVLVGAPYFWVANALFATLALSGLAAAAVKLVEYRRGL